jgi:hypothetical protein
MPAFFYHGDSHRISHALEDLPKDARAQAVQIAELPTGTSLLRGIFDELANAGLDSYGHLERVPLLRFLSDYPVTPYTYEVSPVMARGERPSGQKLADLFHHGHYLVTINLCAELADGDAPAIGHAGLTGKLRTHHIPIVDMDPPTLEQVVELLDIVAGPEATPTYVHCEAGKGRTGVMTACYRMAVLGWSADDALTEAKNFGCSIPMQQAFIEHVGKLLEDQDQDQDPALGRYPLRPPGSVKATEAELTATVAECSRQEKGETV